ncbi:MAG: hypothetical protein QM831_10725 [Kofleriaceae bacterium]
MRVVGVVRSASRLEAMTFETRLATNRATPWLIDHRCELRPLAPDSRNELWSAWNALEAVTTWDATTLRHVLTILRETVPSADQPEDLPALRPRTHVPPEPRATAAHPRAFRGTKYRPPRPHQPDAIDLRPYLLTRRHTDQVLELLGEPRGSDPYVAWNHRSEANAAFDPMFIMYLLPLFRGCAWSDVGAFASIARTLQLHVEPELRAALMGVFLATEDVAHALGWWSHVLAHEAQHRLEIARLVAASGLATLSPIDMAVGATIARLPAVQRWTFCQGLVAGASSAYLESGLQLGAISLEQIEEPPAGRVAVTEIIEATLERLGTAMEEDSGPEFWRFQLWRLCGRQPELIELISLPTFVSLRPDAAFWLVRTANTYSSQMATTIDEWRALAPLLPLVLEMAAKLQPEYQRKFVEDMVDVYWWSIDNEHCVTDALAQCVDLCLRVAKPPFSTKSAIGPLMPSLAMIYSDPWGPHSKTIREAPEASWLALEAACERKNQRRVLQTGFNRISQFAPKLLAATFPATPAALLETADLVDAISYEAARTVLETDSTSPLAEPAIVDAPIERLCEQVAPITRAGGPNPVRRALRRHLAGEAVLTDAQLRGHRERIVDDLGILRLAAIRQGIERVLAARVGIDRIETPTVRHALALLNEAEVHRRQLRRMLKSNIAGDVEWRLRHARTREWFARHTKIDRDVWLRGIETRGAVEGEPVRIAVESDPLEALKLGTYVGSCLGRGGTLEYSAAAVVLDANKQVVYARDSRNAVIGRQLIALSESEELVCFRVYGSAKPALIEPLFREFDQAFATRLGVSIQTSNDYEIASILSHDWWDDNAWLA